MRRVIFGLSLLAVVWPIKAAVYRCEFGGRPVYTDKPCTAGARPHEMAPVSTLPAAADNADLAKQHDARVERERKARDRDDAAWLKAHAEAKDREARMDAAIAEKTVLKDMTPDEVRRALGSPDEVERGADGGEQWIYREGKSRQTVVIRDGQVVKISRSTRKKK